MPTSAANSRAKLSSDELHQLRWLLGLVLALLAFWTLLPLNTDRLATVWISASGVVVVLCLAFPRWPGRLSPWVWRLAGPAVIVAILSDLFFNITDVLPAMVRTVTLLTLYRCIQYRRRREDLQLVLLCLIMTVLSGVLTLSLLFGLQILIFAMVAMALLFVINLLSPAAARALTGDDWKNFHWPRFLGRLRRALDLRLLFFSSLLFAAMVGVTTIIFISMPRFSFEHSLGLPKLHGQSGFSDHIAYDGTDSLDLDDSIAFRVDAPRGETFGTPPYWRMIVLDDYCRDPATKLTTFRASWTPIYREYVNIPRDMPRYEPEQYPALPDLPDQVWKIYLEGDVSQFLPVLGPLRTLSFSNSQFVNGNTTLQVYRLLDTSTNVLGYEIENMPQTDSLLVHPDERKQLLALRPTPMAADNLDLAYRYPKTLTIVPGNPADRAELDGILKEIRDGRANLSARDFVPPALAWLHQHHFGADSLNLKPAPTDRDPLVNWLVSKSPGWCEYFAGSFVLLAREAGYPARVVSGYRGASFNPIENYYVVRQSDAHAWAEIFDGHDHWLRVDPTPGAADPFAGAPMVAAALIVPSETGWSARLDSLRMVWYRRVINFDQADQQQLAESVKSNVVELLLAIKTQLLGYGRATDAWFKRPFSLRRELFLLGFLLALGALFFSQHRLRNTWLRLAGSGWLARWNRQPPVRRQAGRWLRRFLPVCAALAPRLTPPARADWNLVRHDLLALRYGPMDTLPDPLRTFRHARTLLRRAARG